MPPGLCWVPADFTTRRERWVAGADHAGTGAAPAARRRAQTAARRARPGPPPPRKMVVTKLARPPATWPPRLPTSQARRVQSPRRGPDPSGARRPRRAALLTHRPVAKDRDLPGLGLRHLGDLLSPGPTTSTAATAAAAAAIGGGRAGAQPHTEQGRRQRARLPSLPRWLARPTARNRPRGRAPPPTTRPRDPAQLPQVSVSPAPPAAAADPKKRVRQGRECVEDTFYFKG